MTLPKIEHPVFTAVIPSTGKKTTLRPMLVKEEKHLLMAKEGRDNNSIILAVKHVVNNCLVSGDVDVNKLTMFDIDYLFIVLRSNSIDSKIKVFFTDEDDPILKNGESFLYNIEVDLNDVKVKFPDKIEKIIKTGKDSGLSMKYPEASVYDSELIAKAETGEKIAEELILACFDSYFQGDKVYNFKDQSRAEIEEFIENLDIKVYRKVIEFFDSIPTITYVLNYTDQQGKEKTKTLNKLQDFFIF